jgi:hypothetical protein
MPRSRKAAGWVVNVTVAFANLVEHPNPDPIFVHTGGMFVKVTTGAAVPTPSPAFAKNDSVNPSITCVPRVANENEIPRRMTFLPLEAGFHRVGLFVRVVFTGIAAAAPDRAANTNPCCARY